MRARLRGLFAIAVGGPEEFAKSIDQQRMKIAEFAKAIGVEPMPQN